MLTANWLKLSRRQLTIFGNHSDLHTQHRRLSSQSSDTASKSQPSHRAQVLMAKLHPYSQVVIFQPPQLHTKMEDSATVYDGETKLSELKAFLKTNL